MTPSVAAPGDTNPSDATATDFEKIAKLSLIGSASASSRK